MKSQPTPQTTALEALPVQTINPQMLALLEDAADIAQDAKAVNTLRTYESRWKHFCAFCEIVHAPALPAHPATVVSYLAHLARRQKISTLQNKLAAIRHYHLKARVPDPTRDNAVRDVLDGIRRKFHTAPTRKAAVERDVLRHMLAVQPDTLRGVRNRALLLIGFACDLRRSEIVALEYKDVKFFPNRMVVNIGKSKTDQYGEGFPLSVPRIADTSICPAHALKTWLEISKIKSGPLFRKIDRWEHIGADALTDQVVALVIKQSAAACGYDPNEFGGHSLRRGFITQAARNREQSADIRKVSRHKTEIMLDVYRADAEDAQMRVIRGALQNENENEV